MKSNKTKKIAMVLLLLLGIGATCNQVKGAPKPGEKKLQCYRSRPFDAAGQVEPGQLLRGPAPTLPLPGGRTALLYVPAGQRKFVIIAAVGPHWVSTDPVFFFAPGPIQEEDMNGWRVSWHPDSVRFTHGVDGPGEEQRPLSAMTIDCPKQRVPHLDIPFANADDPCAFFTVRLVWEPLERPSLEQMRLEPPNYDALSLEELLYLEECSGRQ
ncbi:MAG: hypothetical protein LBJ38_01575 [Oscillospiraceae bacterium]|jgi:hypothetical protein|nr:hypothetical protein [Oscillospiraceae bacterium]